GEMGGTGIRNHHHEPLSGVEPRGGLEGLSLSMDVAVQDQPLNGRSTLSREVKHEVAIEAGTAIAFHQQIDAVRHGSRFRRDGWRIEAVIGKWWIRPPPARRPAAKWRVGRQGPPRDNLPCRTR